MRPDVWPRQPTDPSRWTWKLLHSWKWKHSGHITELEILSALTAIRWRARSSSLLRTRFALFIDNQSSLAVLVKSLSTSRKLTAVARKTAAILLCTLSRNLYACTGKDRNSADAGSRRQHACTVEELQLHRVHHATVSVVFNTLSQHRLQSRRQKGSVTAVACTVAYTLLLQRCSFRVSTWLHDEGQSPSHDKGGLDAQLCEYLECLWQEGAHGRLQLPSTCLCVGYQPTERTCRVTAACEARLGPREVQALHTKQSIL